jgi:hypothetical protein
MLSKRKVNAGGAAGFPFRRRNAFNLGFIQLVTRWNRSGLQSTETDTLRCTAGSALLRSTISISASGRALTATTVQRM